MRTPRWTVLCATLLALWPHAVRRAEGEPAAREPEGAPAAAPATMMRIVGSAAAPGAAAVSFEPAGARLLAACGGEVVVFDVSDVAAMKEAARFALAEETNNADCTVVDVKVDPRGRGVAAALLVPDLPALKPSTLVFFESATGRVLAKLTPGYAPAAVEWSDDGNFVYTADTGRPVATGRGSVIDPPGGVSIVDVRAMSDAAGFERLDRARPVGVASDGRMFEAAFSAGDAADGGVRIRPGARKGKNPAWSMGPAHVRALADRLYCAYPDNNSVSIFSFASMDYPVMRGVGTVALEIDASAADEGPRINKRVVALPMPRRIAAWEVKSGFYAVATCGGAERGTEAPLGDRATMAQLAGEGRLSQDVADAINLSERGYGQLYVSTIDGLNEEGKIERPLALGGRCVMVFDGETLHPLAHTGSAFERMMAERAPAFFNATAESPEVDAASSLHGPEPDGLALVHRGVGVYAVVGLRNPGAIAIVDLTTPTNPTVVDLAVIAAEGHRGPEGLIYVPEFRSPTGKGLAIAACRGSGTVVVLELDLGR